MALFIGTKEQVEAYRKDERKNQSEVKMLEKGLDQFLAQKQKWEDEKLLPMKEHFIIGSAVDTILTGEEGEYENTFVVLQVEAPTESIQKIVDSIFRDLTEKGILNGENVVELHDLTDKILDACTEQNYQKNWKADTKVDKIIKEGSSYFKDLQKSIGKIAISPSISNRVDTIVKSLRENERTAGFFDREFFRTSKNIDVYYQVPIYFVTEEGHECKALLDIVIIEKDDEGKIIAVFPIDLKTKAGYTIEFPSSIKQRRYDIQGAWYTEALLSENSSSPLPIPLKEIDKTNLKAFQFVVESSTSPGKPLKFTLDDSYLGIGKFGQYNQFKNKFDPKGYKSLLETYAYHEKTGWAEDEEVTKTNGSLLVGYDGLITN